MRASAPANLCWNQHRNQSTGETMPKSTRKSHSRASQRESKRVTSRTHFERITAGVKRNLLPLGLSALAAITATQTGCSSRIRGLGRELTDNLLVEYRDAVWSRRAYNLRYGNCDRPYGNHYRDGFCAGYMDVCNGGDGYVPALPPSEYRGYEYQCAEGAKCVNTWFEGYPAGVAAAKQDRSGDFKDMFISRMVNSAVVQDKAKHMLPGDVPIVDSKGTRSKTPGTDVQAPPVPPTSNGSLSKVSYTAPTNVDAVKDAQFQMEVRLDGPQASGTELIKSGQNSVSIIDRSNSSESASSTPRIPAMRPALPPIVKSSAAPIISAAEAQQVITNEFTR